MGNINTLLSLNGESEFKRQITAINNNLTTLDKALKETASLFTQESDRMKLTTATSQNLERQLDLLRQKQQMLNQAVMGSAKTVQDSTKDLMNARQAWANTAVNVDLLRKKLDEAKSGTTASRQEIRELEKQLKLAEQAHKDAGKAVEDAERRVARAKAENQKYRQQLADTGTQINNTEAQLRRLTQEEDNQARTTQNATNYTNQFKTALTGLKTALEAAGTACAKIAQAELKGLQLTFQAVGKELELGVSGIKKYTEAVAAAGIAIGSFGAAKGMDFEASMSRVSAYSNASSEDLERLAAAAKDMGATTSKTASEAADALGYLALNGYDTEEMLSSLKPIVKASEAGNMGLATAANSVATVLKAYGKEAGDTEEFLNVLTAAQNNSATSMEELLTTYRDLSGTFKMLDVDFNESATLLGLVANRGLKGAQAGTALNSVMLRLLGTNKNAKTALDGIGVSAWDAEGNFRGLTTTLRDVNSKMQEMTTEQKAMFEKDVAGVMRFEDFMYLLEAANDLEAYNELYNEVSHSMENNYLYNTAETMMDNLKGRITILKSATEALGISIFETFSDKATYNVEKMTFWVNKLNDGVKNGDLLKQLDQVAAGISDALIQSINLAARELPSKLKLFNSAIINGVKILIKGISHSKNTILPELITGAKELVLGLVEQLPAFTKEVTDGAVILFTGIVDALGEISEKLVEVMPDVIDTLLNAITEHGPEIFGKGFEVLMTLIRGIMNNLPKIMESGQKILNKLISGINKHMPEIVKSGLTILGALLQGIADNLGNILQTAFDILDEFVKDLTEDGTLEKLIDAAIDIMNALLKFMFDNLPTILEKWVPKIMNGIAKQLMDEEKVKKLDEAGDYLGGVLARAIWSGLKAVFSSGYDIGLRAILNMMGIKGDYADIVMDLIDVANKHAAETAEAGILAQYGVYEQPAAGTRPAASRREKNVETTPSINYSDDFIGPKMPNINLYNPVFNNTGDTARIAEQTSQLQRAATTAGGRY